MLASPLYVHGRGENYGSSHKLTASGKPEAKMMQKRRAIAQRTQADHCRRERERELDVKFISRATSVWETRCSVSNKERRTGKPTREFYFFNLLIHQKLGRPLLEGNKDHLLSQARSELMKQEHQVGSLNSCINELQQQASPQGLELQDAHRGFLNLEGNKLVYKKNYQ